ncbi:MULTISPECIES: LytTR family DNA-binding domain-containing protein [Peptoniphilus]|uniref:LytTR family DNA-binding domain-containing protein n=1 Tax=Peptoniphilus TaxID=162289 RepID=UPI0001DA9EEE|nr:MULTISPECIES: LytTR family DNA-binding domain-containing protein [Peptoniphilus]EFI41540.1 LytTr DNA-binding domain protein [Peptoniphilus sp. oral taxon 386 str. F0131]
MKLEIIIDEIYKETLLKVFSSSINEDVRMIENFFYETNTPKIIGFKDDEAFIIDADDIVRFFTEDKNTFIQTEKDKFLCRLRIYEIEEKFKNSNFIKVSRGEIVNLDYIKKLDLSFKGTIAIQFKNGDVSYISRRNLSSFKKALGL